MGPLIAWIRYRLWFVILWVPLVCVGNLLAWALHSWTSHLCSLLCLMSMASNTSLKFIQNIISWWEVWAECRPRQRLHLKSQLTSDAGPAGPAEQYSGPAAASSREVGRTLDGPRHFLQPYAFQQDMKWCSCGPAGILLTCKLLGLPVASQGHDFCCPLKSPECLFWTNKSLFLCFRCKFLTTKENLETKSCLP